MELNGIKLFPSEVVVHITRVDDISHWTREVEGEKTRTVFGFDYSLEPMVGT